MISAIILVIVTIFLPPVGVFLISGCSADFFINILLTLLGYLPGHIHAFYLEYVYYHRKEQAERGIFDESPAPGVYSRKIQTGGNKNYGTLPQQQPQQPIHQGYPEGQQPGYAPQGQQGGYVAPPPPQVK